MDIVGFILGILLIIAGGTILSKANKRGSLFGFAFGLMIVIAGITLTTISFITR